MKKTMKSNELLKKILNKEIKSGQRIKMHKDFMNGYDIYYIFHGNWFGREDWDENTRADDILLEFCDDKCTFELLDEEEFEDIKEIPIPKIESNDNARIVNVEIKLNQLIRNQKKIIEKLGKEVK